MHAHTHAHTHTHALAHMSYSYMHTHTMLTTSPALITSLTVSMRRATSPDLEFKSRLLRDEMLLSASTCSFTVLCKQKE